MNAKSIAPKTLSAPVTAIAKAMKEAKAKAPAIIGGHDAKVASLIGAAMKASDTLTAKAKEAAKLAAAQFNPEASPNDNVKAVAALYEGDFKDKTGKVNSNVKSIFTDCLWLLAAAAAPVSFVKKTAKGEEEIHTTAAQAVDLSKHDLRAAASSVREDLGKARKSGGGRPRHNTPTRPTAASKAAPESEAAGPVAVADAETVFLANLAAYLTDVAMIAKIKATCTEAGFTLAKARAKK